LLAAVGRTAVGVARVRALESARPDGLFDDPFAAAFADTSQPSADTEDTPQRRAWRAAIAFHIIIRTRFYDDYLRDAVAAGCRQIVLLGAGLDTRAFRLAWPSGVQLFEVDQPNVLRLKGEVLRERGAQPRCDRVTIAADLRTGWSSALVDAGMKPSEPTAWLAEGLLVYLERDVVTKLVSDATTLSAPGSRFAAERGDATAPDTVGDAAESGGVTRLWHIGDDRNTARLLTAAGWTAIEHDLGDVAASYDRTPPRDPHSGFVTAVL